MIRLLRRLGRFPAGTETDFFDAAAEAAFVSDGTAEPIGKLQEIAPTAPESGETSEIAADAPDWRSMKKDDLLHEAMARGLDVSPRARVGEIVEALEADDADA